MNPLFGDVPVEDGVIQLGSKDRGCRHCGAVEVTVSACGRVAWWHPGTNCCAAAIRDRVGWREEELAAHRSAYKRADRDIADVEAAAAEAHGKERQRLEREAQAMRAGLQVRVNEVWRPAANEIEAELADDRRRLAGLTQTRAP